MPDAPDLNVSLLDRVLNFIKRNPRVHTQNQWLGVPLKVDGKEFENPTHPAIDKVKATIPGDGEVCGTAACFAGWALMLEHERYTLIKTPDGGRCLVRTDALVKRGVAQPGKSVPMLSYREMADRGLLDQRIDVEYEARHLLGLDFDEATALFHGDNDIEKIEKVVGDIKSGSYRDHC